MQELLFEENAQENGLTYWDARDLMDFLGYKNYATFEKVINKARSNCLDLGIEINEEFEQYSNKNNQQSYKLSRFACFIVTLQADDKKENVKKAKVYFAKFASELISQTNLLERLEERKNLTAGEKSMQASAYGKGLPSNKFGIFKDSGIRGMYNMPLSYLKTYKNLGAKTDAKNVTLYDFVNLEEMAANTFRTTQTAAKIRNTQNMTEKGMMDTAKEVGKEVRDIMIKNSGAKPEDIPLEDLFHQKNRLHGQKVKKRY